MVWLSPPKLMLKFVIGTVLGSGVFKDRLKTMVESGMITKAPILPNRFHHVIKQKEGSCQLLAPDIGLLVSYLVYGSSL